jgi:restriction system protein
MLKRAVPALPFDPGDLGKQSPDPRWEDFAPTPPGALSGLLGGKARHARALDDAQQAYQQALAEHRRTENRRIRQLQSAREAHDQRA